MRTYRANSNGLGTVDDGHIVRTLNPRFDLARWAHAFSWGERRAQVLNVLPDSRSQLALAILCDCLGDDERALALTEKFKAHVIARQDRDAEFSLSDTKVVAAINEIEMGAADVLR